MTTQTTAANASTGPKTAEGKAISARNATTHGLFCRQTVLPHLGEDPAAYQSLLDHLNEQVRPRNLMEKQYIELWADASWKLRRLSRLEAQIWENDTLDEDARLTKLERLGRLQNSTRRQMDKSIRMLGRDLHDMFAHRTREDVLSKMELTETQVQELVYRRKEVERTVQANTYWPAVEDHLAGTLDAISDNKNCQNELPAPLTAATPTSAPNPPVAGGPCERSEQGGGQFCGGQFSSPSEAVLGPVANKNCENELPASPSPLEGEGRSLATGERVATGERADEGEPEGVLPPFPGREGTGRLRPGLGSSAPGLGSSEPKKRVAARPRISDTMPPIPINFERERRQLCEDILNNPKVPIEDRCDILRDLGCDRVSFEEGGPGVRVLA